jgi:hypothetical protein
MDMVSISPIHPLVRTQKGGFRNIAIFLLMVLVPTPVNFWELLAGGGLPFNSSPSSKHRGSEGFVGSSLVWVDCGMMFIKITTGPRELSFPGMVT